MKREFYKLSLVAIMVVFSFSLGFFLGREVTLARHLKETESSKKEDRALVHTPPLQKEPPSPSLKLDQSPHELPAQTQRERVKQYKKGWEKQQTKEPANREKHQKSSPYIETKEPANREKHQKALKTEKSTLVGQAQSPESQKDNPSTTTKPLENPAHIRYALRVQRHETRERAMKQSADLKLKFPERRFFFRKVNKTYTVYMGPWALKKSAEAVEQSVKNKKEFSSVKLEKIKL